MKSWLFASLLVVLPCSTVVAAEGNPLKGEELFQQCVICHNVGSGAEHGVGPALNHVFGRQAGTAGTFQYSDALIAKGAEESLVWDEKSLYIFLAGPERYVPGTIMGFEGLRTEQQIKDVLAYMIQYSPAYKPDSGEEVPAEVAEAAVLPEQRGDAVEEVVPEFPESFLMSADAIGNGGDLWGKQCRHCHGNSAYPGKAPKLKPLSYTPEFVFSRVTDGFRKMPAWKTVFTLEERKNIVAYVLSNKFSP
ncbi:MAG: c-type cytochrome [Granulosicoccus sp.]